MTNNLANVAKDWIIETSNLDLPQKFTATQMQATSAMIADVIASERKKINSLRNVIIEWDTVSFEDKEADRYFTKRKEGMRLIVAKMEKDLETKFSPRFKQSRQSRVGNNRETDTVYLRRYIHSDIMFACHESYKSRCGAKRAGRGKTGRKL